MGNKKDNGSPFDTNKQMLEIKKKIQLSEGQRKAAFEDCDSERKNNVEEIRKLKKEINDLVGELRCKTRQTSGLENLRRKFEKIIGPCEDKKSEEIKEMLDLQIIDKGKALDLISYKIRKRLTYLNTLASQLRDLLEEKSQKGVTEKVDRPVKKISCDLQNDIHAVEVQFREANHISLRYQEIKKALLKDSSRFQSNIKKIEEELEEQKEDIEELQKVLTEATAKRSAARCLLLREERHAASKGATRDRHASEGRRLVARRRRDLEHLESRLLHVSKKQEVLEDEGEGEEVEPELKEEGPRDAFEILRKATGAGEGGEVLTRFKEQKEMLERLGKLREEAEQEKKRVEGLVEELEGELEAWRYREVKEGERKTQQMEGIQSEIEVQKERSVYCLSHLASLSSSKDTLINSLQLLHSILDPHCVTPSTPPSLLSNIRGILQKMGEVNGEEEVKGEEPIEEKWLPPPYNGLVRRTPLPPPPGTSPAPPPPGSEEEEEVPSRGFLKRQAQLVVDAKLRRKTLRLPTQKKL